MAKTRAVKDPKAGKFAKPKMVKVDNSPEAKAARKKAKLARQSTKATTNAKARQERKTRTPAERLEAGEKRAIRRAQKEGRDPRAAAKE